MRRVMMGALVWLVASAPLAAELKYTVRLESRKAAMSTDVDPMLWMLGEQVLEAAVPNGPLDVTIMVGHGAARAEWSRALPGIPEGAIVLLPASGNRIFMINPATKTYWRVNMPNLYTIGQSRRPVVTLTPVDEPALVAGVAVTKADVHISIPFVEAQRGEMVSGTPTELPLSGEVWSTDRYAEHWLPRLRPILGLPILGFNVAPARNFVLRQILRGPLFGDYELESVVTAIAEEELPEMLFQIPEGFTLVPTPRPGR